MLEILLNTLLESAPYVILGFLIAGAVKVWVPHLTLERHLAGHGAQALFKSVGIGCLLPICSCGTIPIGLGLYRCGAAVGNVLAFMTSAPVLSPIVVLISLRLLGSKLTLMLLSAAILNSLMIGVLGNRLFRGGAANERTADGVACSDCMCADEERWGSKTLRWLRWSFCDLGAEVSVDIAIGLSIASLLLAVLPLEWISTWLGRQELSTLLYVVILGIPVYACSVPSIPVVQGLLLLGATPGAGVAYLMAGPATNLGELNAIRHNMGLAKALYYASMLVIMALVAGTITDHFVFPDYQYHAYRQQGELVVHECCVPQLFGDVMGEQVVGNISSPWWHWPFAVLLTVVIIHGLCKKLKWFFINPCLGCTRKEFMDGACGGKCHVRRKYDMLSWIWRGKE
jgi:uncharacterized protein